MAISCNCLGGGSPEDDAVIRKERENKKIGQKIDKGNFFLFLQFFAQNVNVARFARNVVSFFVLFKQILKRPQEVEIANIDAFFWVAEKPANLRLLSKCEL